MSDSLYPSLSVLVKLGSIMVHAEEGIEPGAHSFDRDALKALLADPDVRAWRKQMDELALLPVKRS